MTSGQKDKCKKIIHTAAASGATAAIGLAQLPGADNAILIPIEIGMVVGLGSVFGISLSESAAKSLIAGATGTIVGRGVSQFLVGWIPLFGNLVNAGTAAAVIEGLGWVVVKNFENGKNRNIENYDR